MNFSNLKLKNIEYLIKYKPNSLRWACTNRKNHIIGVQLHGKADHDFKYQKFTMSENCIYFFNQKDDYSVEVLEKGEAFSVHFTTYEPIATNSFCIKIKDITNVLSIQEKIMKYTSSSFCGNNMAASYFYMLCALFEDIYNKEYFSSDERMINAKDYIDLHFAGKNCLSHAVYASGISKRRFNDLFKKQFDITPNRYLISRKINFAKQLLESNPLSLSEVSDKCGFSDTSYFNKVFKKETTYTPGEYKKIYQSD